MNNDYAAIPYFVINNLKNIVSYNLNASDNISLLLSKIPQIGQSFVDIFPLEQTSYVSEIVDKCLAGNTVIADQGLIKRIVKSSLKIQILFISVHINENISHAVCLFLPDFGQQKEVLSLNDHSKFISHELRAPVSNILS